MGLQKAKYLAALNGEALSPILGMSKNYKHWLSIPFMKSYEEEKMKKAVVDLTDCKHLDDLHKRFKVALGFPDHYGENLDAFWDCINADCDVNFITVIGSETVAENLKETLETMFQIMERNKKDWAPYDWPFDYEIIK